MALRSLVVAVIVGRVPGVVPTMKIATMIEIMHCANVLGKEKVEGPVECHPNLFVQAGQLTQINRPPHPPGEET